MALIHPYDSSEWLNQQSGDTIENAIDYFFTQRKITEVVEVIDEKTLERKQTKHSYLVNFLAINLPINQFKSVQNLEIDIEIWGDDKYVFKSTVLKKSDEVPHLMLKLKDDKQLFVKLIFKEKSKTLRTFINFINIIKRYQQVPDTK